MLAAPAASILGLPKLSPSANQILKQHGQALLELRRTISLPCENVHVANYGQHLESRHLRAMRISRRGGVLGPRDTVSCTIVSFEFDSRPCAICAAIVADGMGSLNDSASTGGFN